MIRVAFLPAAVYDRVTGPDVRPMGGVKLLSLTAILVETMADAMADDRMANGHQQRI